MLSSLALLGANPTFREIMKLIALSTISTPSLCSALAKIVASSFWSGVPVPLAFRMAPYMHSAKARWAVPSLSTVSFVGAVKLAWTADAHALFVAVQLLPVSFAD